MILYELIGYFKRHWKLELKLRCSHSPHLSIYFWKIDTYLYTTFFFSVCCIHFMLIQDYYILLVCKILNSIYLVFGL